MSDEPPTDPASVLSVTGPQTEHDWTIHSINIQGVFFERWCQAIINSTEDWRVTTTNYPVAVGGHQSALDIRADLERGQRRIILLVECKKNNPDFVNWVFFPKDRGSPSTILLPHIETQNPVVNPVLRPVALSWTRLMNDARETRGNYLSYKKGDK